MCPQEATILGTPSGLHDVASGQVDVQISDYFAAERCWLVAHDIINMCILHATFCASPTTMCMLWEKKKRSLTIMMLFAFSTLKKWCHPAFPDHRTSLWLTKLAVRQMGFGWIYALDCLYFLSSRSIIIQVSTFCNSVCTYTRNSFELAAKKSKLCFQSYLPLPLNTCWTFNCHIWWKCLLFYILYV